MVGVEGRECASKAQFGDAGVSGTPTTQCNRKSMMQNSDLATPDEVLEFRCAYIASDEFQRLCEGFEELWRLSMASAEAPSGKWADATVKSCCTTLVQRAIRTEGWCRSRVSMSWSSISSVLVNMGHGSLMVHLA